MISPKIQDDDKKRVESLKLYQIHGTKEEEEYDLIAKLASSICCTKVSLVSFIDSNCQWFKACVGTDLNQNTRELAICSHAINDIKHITYIPNMSKDIRFKYHPMVIGETNVQFYAGVPILSREGYAIGTICVMDHVPKNLNSLQIQALTSLRDVVSNILEIRRNNLSKHTG